MDVDFIELNISVSVPIANLKKPLGLSIIAYAHKASITLFLRKYSKQSPIVFICLWQRSSSFSISTIALNENIPLTHLLEVELDLGCLQQTSVLLLKVLEDFSGILNLNVQVY